MQNVVSKLRLFSLVALLSNACQNAEPDAKASEGSSASVAAAPSVAAGSPMAAGSPEAGTPRGKYDEEAFQLIIEAPSAARVGESVEVVIHLTAQSGYKVNPEYPLKFTFETSDAATAEIPVLKKEQGTVEKGRAELRGKVKLPKAGKQLVGGKLSFSVCTDERCLIEKRDLALPITVS